MSGALPPLPEGFKLDSDSSSGQTPELPEGFKLDQPQDAEAQANAAQTSHEEQQSKYGSGLETAKAGLEAVGQGIAGPLATAYEISSPEVGAAVSSLVPGVGPALSLAKQAIGQVNPEDIRGREEANPLIHAAGTIGGLLTPGGEGSLLEKAGAGILKGVEHVAPNMIGEGVLKGAMRGAVKVAAENAIYQSGDEVSKMIKEDPNQSLGSAISNIGLAGLIGGAGGAVLGSVSPLWKATLGEKAEGLVSDFKARMREHLELPEELPVQGESKELYDPFMKQNIPEGSSAKSVADKTPIAPTIKEIKPEDIKPLAETPGGKLADMFIKHADKLGGQALAGTVGGAIGHATGIPYGGTIGTILGEKILSPILESILPAISKPIMEKMVSGDALKAAIDYSSAVVKGTKLADSIVSNVVKGSSKTLPDTKLPDKESREKLNAALDTFQKDPGRIANIGGQIGHYLPDHAMAIGSMASNAVQFLTSIRPQSTPRAPLDPPRVISTAVQSQYDRVLDIAQQPLIVLESIKDNTLTSHDVMALHILYPDLYAGLRQKVMNQIVEHTSKGETIPYDTRLGLSMFLGQPLDSTMSPMAISAAQPAPEQAPAAANSPKKMSQGAANNAIKGSKTAQTASQASEAMHVTGKA